jgi:tetrahydromethanopterin S-methyltransferase subunit F
MSTELKPPKASSPHDRGNRELIAAWVSVALMAGFFAAIVLVEVTLEVAQVFLFAAMLASAASSVWFGLSARRHGLDSGLLPARIGGFVGGFFVALIVLSVILHFGFGFE